MNKHIYFFIGTTAELIKLAPVIKELKKRDVPFRIIASGQNDILFNELSPYLGKITIDTHLGEKYKKSSVINFAFWTFKTAFVSLIDLRKEFKDKNSKNTFFIVHGDTVSSMLGAIIAKVYSLKLVHIESGLRSFNFFEPFPEEACRYIVSHLSDVHFCPNEWCCNNLSDIKGRKINTFQNTLIESSHMALESGKENVVRKYKLKQPYFVLVAHRQEHVIFGKSKTRDILKEIFENIPDGLTCAMISHQLTKNFLKSMQLDGYIKENKSVKLVPRLSHIAFTQLIADSEFIITDGGSNQEEAYYYGKPCLLLRNRTERIEGLDENVVISHNNPETVLSFLKKYKKYKRKPVKLSTLPSHIIVNYLTKN